MKRIFKAIAKPFRIALRALGLCVFGALYLLTFSMLIVVGGAKP